MTETVEAKQTWPTHPDGTNKRMGEMTAAEYAEQMSAARARFFEQASDLEARLSLRDTFICEKGLWNEFATTVLASTEAA